MSGYREAGYEFGIRERIMASVDPAIVDLLGARVAVAYGRVPSLGVLVNAPAIFFVFTDERSARHCFQIFQDWIRLSGNNGDAVDVTFIEFNTGSYGVVSGPEPRRLLERSVPADLENDFEPLVVAPSRMLEVPRQSEGYRWFRQVAKDRPFVVAPATQASGPIMELAFHKREVAFYKESEVPENHPASAYARRGRSPRSGRRTIPNPEGCEIRDRRNHRLKRFFPVTLERLRFNSEFETILAALQNKGVDPWEIRQAVCNLTLQHRHPELYPAASSDDQGQRSVVGFLIEHPETVDDAPLPTEFLTIETIWTQTKADRRRLLEALEGADAVTALSDEDVTKQLNRLGMV